MFTGIVSDVGTVIKAEQRADLRLTIRSTYEMATVDLGASICCSGVCLTVADKGNDWFAADLSIETLSRTARDLWIEGARLNLERSLRVGDELGGHFVTGHVDCVGEVVRVRPEGGSTRIGVSAPRALGSHIAAKGSIALDGVSLTVNTVEGDDFTVLIIPHTLKVTSIGALKAGDDVNLEIDTMARYAARLMEAR